MPDTDVQVAPSATADVADSSPELNDNPATFTREERHEWQKSGKLPAKAAPKPADSEPAKETSSAAPEQKTESESAPAPEAGKEQETRPKRTDGENRWRQLNAENKRLKAEIEAYRTRQPETKAAPSPAPAEQFTRPKPKLEDKNSDGSAKFANYEEFIEDLGRWSAEQQFAKAERERTLRDQRGKLDDQINEARKRYPDFNDKFVPVLRQITDDPQINMAVKQVINASEVLPDLLYVMGSDAEDLEEIISLSKSDPIRAIRKVALLESLIIEELNGAPETTSETAVARNDKGQFESKPPEKKVTSAPPPPREIGGKQPPPADERESAVEKGDYNAYATAANRADLARKRR